MKNKVFVGAVIAISLLFANSMVTIASGIPTLETLKGYCHAVTTGKQLKELAKGRYVQNIKLSFPGEGEISGTLQNVSPSLNRIPDDLLWEISVLETKKDAEEKLKRSDDFIYQAVRNKILKVLIERHSNLSCTWILKQQTYLSELPHGVTIYFGIAE